jgi:agmatinase
MGGDHSVTLGELRAMHRRYGEIALVQLDAHADVYESYFDGKVRYNAGTFVRRAVEEGLIDAARSTLIGIRSFRDANDDARRLGFAVFTMDDTTASPPTALAEHVRARIEGRPAFLSFDTDAIDPAYAPATGSQVPGGLTSREALAIVRSLRDISFVGFDVVEVNPLLEGSRTTATLAANLIFEFMSLIALRQSS